MIITPKRPDWLKEWSDYPHASLSIAHSREIAWYAIELEDRVRCSEEINSALLEAVKDALAFLDRPDITTYEWYKLAPDHVGKFRRALAKAEYSK